MSGLAQAMRAELAGIVRDRQVAMILILALAVYGLIYPAPYRPELLRDVPVVAVDLDGGDSARALLRAVDASEAVAIAGHAADMSAAVRLVETRAADGILLIPSGFGSDLLAGRPSPVAIYADASYFLIYQKVMTGIAVPVRQMGVQVAAGRIMAGQEIDEATALALANPVRLVEVPLFNPSGGYATYVLPAALVLILQQTQSMGLALVAVRRAPGARGAAAMLGRAAVWLAIYTVLLPVFLVLVPWAYGLPWLGNLPLLAALGLPFVLATGMLAQLVAALLRRTEVVQPVLLAMGLPLFFLSGFAWPAEAIPAPLGAVAAAIPSTAMIDGYTRLAAMGAQAADLSPAIRHLWTLAGAYAAAAWLIETSRR